MFSVVLKLILVVGGKQAVHFIHFKTFTSVSGLVVNPSVPPLICTVVAVAASAVGAALIRRIPPRLNNH
jgi:hypothetical protein